MFERPEHGERALLVHVADSRADLSASAEEFELLADAAGADACLSVSALLRRAEPRYLLGSGKAAEIAELVKETGAELVIFGQALSPSQERNLEALFCARVLDRSGLILDIFAQRAQSFEGKLQVELAQLRHLSTRLIRGWTHLERQKGGIGLRGPGETQLETDRRLLANRIRQLTGKLDKIVAQREQRRSRRRKADVPTISLVGYTNAGKSTLFNKLTDAGVYQADKLFATLDPTLRRLDLEGGGETIVVDTVGFIRELPTELVAAFRATLEETAEASLLLHVVDAADPELAAHIQHVDEVLADIGADNQPRLLVYNKIDVCGNAQPELRRDAEGQPKSVHLSARSGAGLELLMQALRELVGGQQKRGELQLSPADGRLHARLVAWQAIEQETVAENGSLTLQVNLSDARHRELEQLAGRTLLLADDIAATSR